MYEVQLYNLLDFRLDLKGMVFLEKSIPFCKLFILQKNLNNIENLKRRSDQN